MTQGPLIQHNLALTPSWRSCLACRQAPGDGSASYASDGATSSMSARRSGSQQVRTKILVFEFNDKYDLISFVFEWDYGKS